MPQFLKNKNIEIEIDLPEENYNFSRFDWTGKIISVRFQEIQLASAEITDCMYPNYYGKGFYNEFGIDTALGFEAAKIGGWFHKIGIGLLKKETAKYHCNTKYEIKPAEFQITANSNSLLINCISADVNGYSYVLKKEILLREDGFVVNYYLENTGEKEIITDEYVHNFTSVDSDPIGTNYSLYFPFQLKPALFLETVDPERKVTIGAQQIKFKGTPQQPFFFSNLSGDEYFSSAWKLTHSKSQIGIRETGNFPTNKVNLWGNKHVISPELFKNILLKPGQIDTWSRTYHLFKTL
jgi:hypothetical protein